MSAEAKKSQTTGDKLGENECSGPPTLALSPTNAKVPNMEDREYDEFARADSPASTGPIAAPDPNENSSACQDGQMPGLGAEISLEEVGQGLVESSSSTFGEDEVSDHGMVNELAVDVRIHLLLRDPLYKFSAFPGIEDCYPKLDKD